MLGMSSSLLPSLHLKFYHLCSTFNQDLVSLSWTLTPLSLLRYLVYIKTQPMLSFIIKELLCVLILAFKIQPFLITENVHLSQDWTLGLWKMMCLHSLPLSV